MTGMTVAKYLQEKVDAINEAAHDRNLSAHEKAEPRHLLDQLDEIRDNEEHRHLTPTSS